MTPTFKIIGTAAFIAFLLNACTETQKEKPAEEKAYTPDSQALYDTIVQLDSVFFGAYNRCDLEVQAAFYADSIEFYHDKGGLMTSKQAILDGTKKYVCGKVTRIIEKGSIEVYPINGFGAIEMGQHRFSNSEENNGTPSEPGKFIIIWQKTGSDWKIKRVVSLH